MIFWIIKKLQSKGGAGVREFPKITTFYLMASPHKI